MLEYYSNSVDSTKELGKKFAKILKNGDVIVLSGDLGAGKTMFVSGFLNYYDKENEVASPTFTIVNEHNLKNDLNLYHFDVYRFDFEDEFTAIGGEEFFDKGICIIEWGEKIKNLLPLNYLKIKFEKDENDTLKRHITFTPIGERYEAIGQGGFTSLKVLAIETSGSNCSVAIASENKIIADFSCNTGTTHSQNLMPMVDQALKFANLDLNDIDILASSIGPGSFTGLRIGIATIKGIALSLNKKVIGVPSLLGLAYNIPYFDGIIASVIDARNNNVYSALYKYTDKPNMIGEYISDSVDVLIDKLKEQNSKILFVGDGAIAYKEKFIEIFGENAHFVPYHLNTQSAISIAKCAIDKSNDGEYDTCDTIHPMYLKKSQAERMLEE